MMLYYGFDKLHVSFLVSKDYGWLFHQPLDILGVLNEENSLG